MDQYPNIRVDTLLVKAIMESVMIFLKKYFTKILSPIVCICVRNFGGSMLRSILLSKIHRATITQTDLEYVGSITIDAQLLEITGMKEFEKVEIFDLSNGNRFETYIIEGVYGSGEIGVNGAAARLVHRGDKIIIVNYAMMNEEEMRNHTPKVLTVDDNNQPLSEKIR